MTWLLLLPVVAVLLLVVLFAASLARIAGDADREIERHSLGVTGEHPYLTEVKR